MGGGKRTCLHPQRLAYALTAFGNRFLATLFFSAIGYICPSKGLSHLKKCGIRLLSDIRNTGECNYCDAGSQNDVLHHRRTQLTRSQESDDCSRLVILSFSFHKNHLDSVRFCHSPGYLSSARPPLAACLAGNYNSSGLAATRTPLGGGAVSPSVPPGRGLPRRKTRCRSMTVARINPCRRLSGGGERFYSRPCPELQVEPLSKSKGKTQCTNERRTSRRARAIAEHARISDADHDSHQKLP